jgi:hypothetical protein
MVPRRGGRRIDQFNCLTSDIISVINAIRDRESRKEKDEHSVGRIAVELLVAILRLTSCRDHAPSGQIYERREIKLTNSRFLPHLLLEILGQMTPSLL